jgi:hypothetical protein
MPVRVMIGRGKINQDIAAVVKLWAEDIPSNPYCAFDGVFASFGIDRPFGHAVLLETLTSV